MIQASISNSNDLTHFETGQPSFENFFQPRHFINKRAFQKLDLLLLAIESLDTNASQAIIFAINTLGLESYFPNRVVFWKFRCNNPMRKAFKIGSFSNNSLEALIALLSYMADYFYPKIRLLLSSREPENLTIERWQSFESRLNELMIERFNTRRNLVKQYLLMEKSRLARDLLLTLALASGEGGRQRLKASLFDPVL